MVSPFLIFCEMSVVPRAVFLFIFCSYLLLLLFPFLQCAWLYVFIFFLSAGGGPHSQCYSTF